MLTPTHTHLGKTLLCLQRWLQLHSPSINQQGELVRLAPLLPAGTILWRHAHAGMILLVLLYRCTSTATTGRRCRGQVALLPR